MSEPQLVQKIMTQNANGAVANGRRSSHFFYCSLFEYNQVSRISKVIAYKS